MGSLSQCYLNCLKKYWDSRVILFLIFFKLSPHFGVKAEYSPQATHRTPYNWFSLHHKDESDTKAWKKRWEVFSCSSTPVMTFPLVVLGCPSHIHGCLQNCLCLTWCKYPSGQPQTRSDLVPIFSQDNMLHNIKLTIAVYLP